MAESVARGLYRIRFMPRTQHGLVLVPPTAMTVPGSSLMHIRGALVSPPCIAAAVFAACIGLGYAGVMGAMLAVSAVVALAATATRAAFVRRHLEVQAEQHERAKRESTRLKLLRPSGPVRQHQYIELRNLVEEIERVDAAEARRFELQDLLEHFVRLSTNHQRCLDALRLAGTSDLPLALPLSDASRSTRRKEIMLRRMRHREECLRRIDHIADELESIDELIRLVAQRVACPALEHEHEREIERRLWELDEVEAALHQLSA